MLILSRRVGEVIVIGEEIRVEVTKIDRNQVTLAIHAPPDIPVNRLEIHERILRERK